MKDQQQPKHAFRPPTGHGRSLRRGRTSAVFTMAAVAALSASVVVGASATNIKTSIASSEGTNSGKIYFGVDGTVSSAANGMSLARHVYGQVNGNVPDARMVTMGTSGHSYAAIAGAKPGSSTYTNIVRWANTIKARGTLTLFGFDHEPESKYQRHLGSPSQYIAAYRHVADIIRAQGASNVRFVWQMTAYSFRTSGSQSASHYYPGDNYVDSVGADPYNWGSCRGPGPWVQLSTVTDPVLAFARAHGKTVVLAEFASTGGPQRAAWLNSAHKYFIANRSVIAGAFYFDRKATTPEGARCNWSLTSSADVAAFRSIVNDRTYFSS